MNLFKFCGALGLLVLVGCTSDSSSGADSYGSEVYHRHLEKGTDGIYECSVYEDGGKVTVKMYEDIALYDTKLSMLIETKFGDPSSYRVSAQLKGMYKAEDMCEEIHSVFDDLNGTTTCTDGSVEGIADNLNAVPPENIPAAVAYTVDEGKESCDEQYAQATEHFGGLPGEWVTDEYDERTISSEPKEKALSCDVTMESGAIVMSVGYEKKNARFSLADNGSSFNAVEEYHGLDEATLASICSIYRASGEYTDVVCLDNTITYTESYSGMTLEDMAVALKSGVCPALLSGEMGMEELWSVE